MNITPEILIFLFAQKYNILSHHIRRPNQPFSGIRLYDPKEEPEKQYLYVLSEAALRRLSAKERKQFSMVFVAARKIPEGEKQKSFAFTDLSLAVVSGFSGPGALYYSLQHQYQTLLQQENELLLATMDQEREEDVFAYGKKWFPWEYSIVDVDMRLLYRTAHLDEVTGNKGSQRIPSESILELILNREFHEAAKKEDVFYQSMTFNNRIAIARNILVDREYAGRVVMFLEESESAVPEGAVSLFRFFTDCVRESLRRSGHFAGRKQNDPLHQLCRSLFRGEPLPPHAITEGLSRSGWEPNQLFSVVVFRFLADSVWEAQLETTLPYLADELELQWPGSCAIIEGREIEWVMNYAVSDGSVTPASFHQQIAAFVRDHICVAGSSPVFHDFFQLLQAKKCAVSALQVGQNKHPDFWYFAFDDYRLEYAKEVLQNALSVEFLRHPALAQLKKYDRDNHTELSKTLKAFLYHGRNMTVAADAIYIHRTTFCRRMDQIRKITGLDLNNPDTALLLELSYQWDS